MFKRSCRHTFHIFVFLFIVVAIVEGSSTVKAANKAPPLMPGTSCGNLHMHTVCSDGRNTYEEMVREARRLNLFFVALTDHIFGGSPLGDEALKLCCDEKRLLCIPGMEVTAGVHLLAVGIQRSIDKRLPVKRQVDEIHSQGGLAIAAHPFRANNTYSDAELFAPGLDAVESRVYHRSLRQHFSPSYIALLFPVCTISMPIQYVKWR